MHRFKVKLDWHGDFRRPPKNIENGYSKIRSAIEDKARILNMDIRWKDSGGCCDGNNIAKHCVVIDTMGAQGSNIHSPDEMVDIDSLVKRSQMLFLLLSDIAVGKYHV